jgi:catalase
MVRNRRIRGALRAAAAAALFCATGYWYAYGAGSPHFAALAAPTAARVVDAFEAAEGVHPGFRRNHAKGICVSGIFESSGSATSVSTADVFIRGSMPVIGRFSLPGGDPAMADNATLLRSLALWIMPPHGASWGMAMNSVPVFPFRTVQEQVDFLRALREDRRAGRRGTMQRYAATHPDAQVFQDWVRTHRASADYGASAYYSVSAFRFIDAQGHVQAGRWRLVPESPPHSLSPGNSTDPDFLSFDLMRRLSQGPLRWRLIISMAMPGDVVDDATQLWPQRAGRVEIDAGTLVIRKAEAQIDGLCRDIDFDPLALPDGIAPSDDPLLAARHAVYAESSRRRLGETGDDGSAMERNGAAR